MSVRPENLKVFLHHLRAIFDGQEMTGEARELVRKAHQCLEASPGKAGEEPARRLPLAEEWLEPALQLTRDGTPALGPLVEAFRDVEPLLHWHHRAGSKAGTAFYEG